MENNNQQGNTLNLMSFDLGEAAGGEQMIFAHKSINDKEHYVFTLGDGPKDEQGANAKQPIAANENQGTKGPVGKSLLESIRKRIPGLNKTAGNQAAPEQAQQNVKLRCFKLTQVEGKKYLVEEYVTPQGVSNVARFFGAGKEEPEVTM